MKAQSIIMGMPASITIVDTAGTAADIDAAFSHLRFMDKTFSTYKEDSEIQRINRGEIKEKCCSEDVRRVLDMCEQTRIETHGYFDIHIGGAIDPSGLVKGLSIFEAAMILRERGLLDFYVEVAGDIQVFGKNDSGKKWSVGIQNPFNPGEIVKVCHLSGSGIATSGNYRRGAHIYDPVHHRQADYIASLTVIGPNVYEADRFATAAFAMGEEALNFIGTLDGFAGYMITNDKKARFTPSFEQYLVG